MPPWMPSCGLQVCLALDECATLAKTRIGTRRFMGSQASVFEGLPFCRPASIFFDCETVHKRYIPSVHVPEESRNALRFAHGGRGHRRARLRSEGRPEPEPNAG